jgi:hypothetical protein
LQRKHPEDLQYPLKGDAAQAALQSLARRNNEDLAEAVSPVLFHRFSTSALPF